ncbi:chorismate mutase [Salimicrobium halophilum]|uniref:chorismate mutase n=1 Tax=Salimicrobium halophilum TaxID=86666 RepID=A0A1G8Q0R9_9BACI|nr:chorismate mutase [Salimicrobium halophilum]SDI98238.1 chorismate mutase [Salimicrobium halophilum]
MIRGIRGATTVDKNEGSEIVDRAYELMNGIVEENDLEARDVAQVMFSATSDINETFPAKALRKLEGWKYVPVMCMQEIEVPSGLERCIRVMVTVNTSKEPQEIKHVYHYEAVKLRPDLTEEGD